MPSSKKKILKDIYMANSMEELNKLADVSTTGTNPALLSKTADRLYTEALSNEDSNDEERAYVFYLRYISVITIIRKTNQYKKDKLYFDKILGTTKPIKAINQAEKLQISLVKRYEERRKLKEDEELAKKVLAKKNDEEKQPKEVNTVQPSSDNNLHDKNVISSSVDIYQKLKVNHSSILTPEGSISNGFINDSDALIPGITNTMPCLTAEQLYSLMKNSSEILILDIRPQKDYAKNHILFESCINIPGEFLEHGVSVSNIDRRLQERTRLVWRERARKQYIVIIDKATKVKTISPSSKLFQFKEAIYKNDSSCQLMHEPWFLDGGFDDWLWHYPSMATKPELPVISSNTSLDNMTDVSSLDFPELPGETKSPPMESKPQPAPITLDNVYPSLIPSQKPSTPNSIPYQHGLTNDGLIAANKLPNHSHVPEKKTDIPTRPPPTVPEAGPSSNPVSKPNEIPGNWQQPNSVPANQDLGQDLSRPHATMPGIKPNHSKLPNNKTFDNNIAGNYQPSTMTTANQISGHPTQPIPGPTSGQFHGQMPNPQQASGQTHNPTAQGNVPGMIPTSTNLNIPGRPSIGQNNIPGQTPNFDQPKDFPGSAPVSTNRNSVPGQTPIITNQNSIPGQTTSNHAPEHRVDHRPVPSPSNVQNQVPGNLPRTQATGQKPGHPPIYGQTAIPSPQPPQNKPPANKGDGLKTTKGLPPGWEQCVDNNNRIFYKDHNTQTTHWNLPTTTQQQNKPTDSTTTKQQFPKQLGTTTPGQTNKLKSNLRRSLSSPNLANLDDDSNEDNIKVDPVFNRSLKPAAKPTFNRSAKPLTTQKIDSLNPVRGGIGRGLTGLRNLGNTCYMNSVLQCLFNTAPLVQYFISGAFRDDLNTRNPMGTRGELAEQFSILVRVANSGQYKSLSPVEFKKTVGKIKSTFSGFDQQDSQEFLALMMDKLHEDVNMILKKPYIEAPGDDIEPSQAAEISWANHKKRNKSIMLELFDGLFMSTVRCLVCRKTSVTFETFSNLTLPIPANSNHCSLQDCISLFTRPEKMSGDDKWYCPQCKQHREASKQLQIWKLPPILVIHLKRFQYDGMWRQKLQTGINFPLENLDMSGYVMGPKRQPSYSLYGVSNHYGTMHGGHYTAFCRNSHDKRWYKFDDQHVSELSNSNSIVTSAGYLLFYTSIPFQPPKIF